MRTRGVQAANATTLLALHVNVPKLRAGESLVHALVGEKLEAEGEPVGVLVALLVHQLYVSVVRLPERGKDSMLCVP